MLFISHRLGNEHLVVPKMSLLSLKKFSWLQNAMNFIRESSHLICTTFSYPRGGAVYKEATDKQRMVRRKKGGGKEQSGACRPSA